MKDKLIEWTAQYIDYNADIGTVDGMDSIYEIKNEYELAEQIVTRIYAVLVPDQLSDQLLDQELDQQWYRLKDQLLDQGNDQ